MTSQENVHFVELIDQQSVGDVEHVSQANDELTSLLLQNGQDFFPGEKRVFESQILVVRKSVKEVLVDEGENPYFHSVFLEGVIISIKGEVLVVVLQLQIGHDPRSVEILDEVGEDADPQVQVVIAHHSEVHLEFLEERNQLLPLENLRFNGGEENVSGKHDQVVFFDFLDHFEKLRGLGYLVAVIEVNDFEGLVCIFGFLV